MKLLIALMVVVMTVEAQEIDTLWNETVSAEIFARCSCSRPATRAQKKALLQEASKRSADFDEILREAEGKPKHDGPRCYTVREIDELREACEKRWLYGTTYLGEEEGGLFWSRAYRDEEKIKAVEELVRTYMLAGITAKQIYEEDKRDYLKRRKK